VGDGGAICILTTRKPAELEGMEIFAKWISSVSNMLVDRNNFDTGV
jgi:hypothetical protein